MGKLTTRQAIRLATKKKKGKKPNNNKGIDSNNGNIFNNSNKIGTKGKKGKGKPAVDNNVTVYNDSEYQGTEPILPETLDTKAKMSDKELRFLALYLPGGHTAERAMILAGYEGYSPNYLKNLAFQIVIKYECRAGDHRKIFRAVGAGEVAIAMGLLDLARNSKSDMVRHNAWNSLSKCMGLSKEVMEHAEGIQIIINQGAPPGEDRPAALTLEPMDEAPPPPAKPLSITK